MKLMQSYSIKEADSNLVRMSLPERWLCKLAVILLVASLFINLGIVPLRLEEPRRALIALEMVFNQNLIVPTEMGEFYYKKPPLYNWVLIGAYYLFGEFSEFASRFFSLLAFLGMGTLIFFIGKKYAGLRYGTYSALLFLVSADILFYFSTTAGEIDLFYSFLTLASFFSLFHFYQKRQYMALFLLTYFFAALGTLTKGFPSIVFLGISLPVFFLYNKDFKQLFTVAHLAGISLYLFLVAGYFGTYAWHNDLSGYFTALWSQSSERTVLEKSMFSMIRHLFIFPLETLKNIAPASLLLLFLFRKDITIVLKQNPLIIFCFFLFVSNILVYWISPGTRSRYVYMLYPLPVMILVYAYSTFQKQENSLLHIIFTRSVTVLISIALLACIALPLIPQLQKAGQMIWISAAFVPVCAVLLWFHLKKPDYSLLQVILLAILLRLVFDFTVLPYRATHTSAYQDKLNAQAIYEIVKDTPLYLLDNSRFSLSTVFYLERAREKVLEQKYRQNTQDYFLADEVLLENQRYQIFYQFSYQNRDFFLIKFTR